MGGSMLCGTCVSPGQFDLTTRDIPETAPEGWVLVDIAAGGLCGTDYHIFQGNQPYLTYPRVIGHELSGHVARAASGWALGARVVINPYLACGTCRACQKGKPNCCQSLQVLGVHRDGGFCSRIAVPAQNLYPAGDLSPEAAAMVEFLAIGAHAVRRGEVAAGDRVLITGFGPIGLGAALFCRLRGAEVHVMDASENRLAQARAFGHSHTHLATAPLPADLADGFDVVFDATGNPAAMMAGFARVAHGGTYVLISVVPDPITFSDPEFHKREMRLIASRNATAQDFDAVMAAFAAGDIRAADLMSEKIALADLPARLPELAADRSRLIKVIVTMENAA